MYLQVYPIKRLPRRFKSFTYELSESKKGGHEISRGSFVLVPWRSRVVRGVVSEVNISKPDYNVKEIETVLDERMSSDELGVYETMSDEMFQSVSSLLETSFPKPRKRLAKPTETIKERRGQFSCTIKKSEVEDLKSALETASEKQFVWHHDVLQTTILVKMLRGKLSRPIMYILPHQHDLEIASDILQTWNEIFCICSGELTEAQRCDIAREWRLGQIPILITTRLGATLLPPTNLGAIVVGRSGVSEHAQYDRNPRYDARSFALSWAKLNSAAIFFADTSPRCADMVKLEKIKTRVDSPGFETIVDLATSVRFSSDVLMSDELKNAIAVALEKKRKTLLICNQKGIAGKLACKSCSFTETCKECKSPLSVYETHLYCKTCDRTTMRPSLCRKCGGKDLREVRRGTGALTKIIKEIWPNARVSIIEKGTDKFDQDADITVATTYYYESVYHPLKDKFGLIGLVCADQITRQNSLENAARQILEYCGVAVRHQAVMIIQTWETGLLKRIISSPLEVIRRECSSKKDLGQAPFVNELHLIQRGIIRTALDDLLREIKTESTDTLISQFAGGGVKILTTDNKLIEKLRSADDKIVINNKTYL